MNNLTIYDPDNLLLLSANVTIFNVKAGDNLSLSTSQSALLESIYSGSFTKISYYSWLNFAKEILYFEPH